MSGMFAAARHELGIFKTSKPIKEDKSAKKAQKKEKEKEHLKDEEKQKQKVKEKDNRLTVGSKKSSPQPQPRTQRLFMKGGKKAVECTAQAVLHNPSKEHEKTQKTVHLTKVITPKKVVEKVELSIPTCDNKAKESSSRAAAQPQVLSRQNSVTADYSTIQKVEEKLNEIALQAELLAESIKRANLLENESATQSPEKESKKRNKKDITVQATADDTDDEDEFLYSHSSEPVHIEIVSPILRDSFTISSSPIPPALPPHFCPAPFPRTTSYPAKALPLLDTDTTNCIFSPIDLRPMSKSDIQAAGQGSLFASRVTRGMNEPTGVSSQDRLAKWKTKLSTMRRVSKDASEPPPVRRMVAPPPPTSKGVAPFPNDSGRPQPRSLHTSKSASNAHSLMLDQLLCSHTNGQASEATASSAVGGGEMHHRTLKQQSTQPDASGKDLSFHFHNINSLQKMMNSLEAYTKGALEAPAKLLPFSGVLHNRDDIIRPIAFRPATNETGSGGEMGREGRDRRHAAVIRGDLAKSASHLDQIGISSNSRNDAALHRPSRSHFYPSTSFSSAKHQQQQQQIENEYDTVPEYFEKSDVGSSTSDYGSIHPTKLSSSTTSSTGSHLSSPPSTNKKSFASRTGSNGLHVTPSPSDSGIVDYESLIRDKENELKEIRSTMEQNEEIIVKVYQEKEKAWKDELEHLRNRLSTSEKGEHALRTQLASCQRQTDILTKNVHEMKEEKNALLRKCYQLERELAIAQTKASEEKSSICAACRNKEAPVPAPRNTKENDLRYEVNELRREVIKLKDALHGKDNRKEGISENMHNDRLI